MNSMQQTPGSEKQGRDAGAIKKKIKHNNNHTGGSSRGQPDRKKKEDSMFYIFTPNRPGDRGRYERTLEAAPSTYDLAGRFQRTQSTMGKL